MPKIRLETIINAPIERVFDLARSIEFHKLSTKQSNDEAVAGKTSGLIMLNETVTWRARHFGIYQKLTVIITKYNRPFMFEDTMVKGTFKSMHHIHTFESTGPKGVTKMTDEFYFTSPFSLLGKIADTVFLKKYMAGLLIKRNQELKVAAEGDGWKDLLAIIY